ncbi:MAG: DUF4399 domain-containing protein [Bacteroidota bacterium]|nr:DUF4399 domain-containing protein [Bacteroidota bacterium]
MRPYWIVPLLILAACQSEPQVITESETETAYVQSQSAEDAVVYIITPEDGDVVQSGMVHVKFGLSGMGIAPAGIEFPNSGHHHLLVNAADVPAMDMPIPTDSAHIHFGLGQTETTLELSPGTYTLQLLLGDYSHTPHDPPVMSEPVTITVE